MKAGAGADNLELPYQGLPASQFDSGQRAKLVELIRLYVGNMDDGHATVKMKEVQAHLDQTYFSWIGETADDSAFYYRVQSPVVLIEYDAQSPLAYGNSSGGAPGGGSPGSGPGVVRAVADPAVGNRPSSTSTRLSAPPTTTITGSTC